MNHFFLMLWLADVLDGLEGFIIVVIIVSAAFILVMGLAYEDGKDVTFFKRNLKSIFIINTLLGLFAIFTPSPTTIRIMATADLSQKAITTIQQSSTGQKALQALNVELDKIIKDK